MRDSVLSKPYSLDIHLSSFINFCLFLSMLVCHDSPHDPVPPLMPSHLQPVPEKQNQDAQSQTLHTIPFILKIGQSQRYAEGKDPDQNPPLSHPHRPCRPPEAWAKYN